MATYLDLIPWPRFEAVLQMPPEEKRIVRALLEGMIVKYQTKRMVGGLLRN